MRLEPVRPVGPRLPVLRALAFLLALGAAAGRAPAQEGGSPLTFYSSEATFDAAFPGLPVEDFGEGVVPAGGATGCPSPLSSTSNNACFLPAQILRGLELLDSTGPSGDGLALMDAGYFGLPSKSIA
jgi:hypothetical protein